MVPTEYSIATPVSRATWPATAVTASFTRSSSFLVATSGTITSGIGALPVRRATSVAASKIARACISAISG